MAEKKAKADEYRVAGNKALSEKKFDEAIEAYTKGITIDSENHILYSNRSAAYAKKEDYTKALEDAEKVVKMKPKWLKGYFRKGTALKFLGRYEEAKMVFEEGSKIDPNDEGFKKELKECEEELSGPAGSQPIGNPFANIEAIKPRLMQDPRTLKYLEDPTGSYMAMLEDMGKDPKNLSKYLKDPRTRVTLSVLLGFELELTPEGMPLGGASDSQRLSDPTIDRPKIIELEDIKEEKPDNVKKALVEKDLGNGFYKKGEYNSALEHYDKAIGFDPTNITFYTNKAAVYLEQGEHVKCRKTCKKAIELGREHRADKKLIAKAFARIGNSYMKEKKYDEAVKSFNASLTEHQVKDTLEKLQTCQKAIKEARVA